MTKEWWELKRILIVDYDIAVIREKQEDIEILSRYLFKMDNMDESQSFLNHITTMTY
mgnify:FL=1